MSDAFRTRRVQITAAAYAALEAWANVHGLDCPDAALEVWLNEKISTDPNLSWLQREWRKRRDKTNSELAQEFSTRCKAAHGEGDAHE